MQLEFKQEMLIPTVNGEMYFQIYGLENWLRRICLAAYMQEFGAEWMSHIPQQALNNIRSKRQKSEDLFYLDLAGEDNLIWMATHAELMGLLLNDKISLQIKRLMNFNKISLSQKLEELRYVRNILAHNRVLN